MNLDPKSWRRRRSCRSVLFATIILLAETTTMALVLHEPPVIPSTAVAKTPHEVFSANAYPLPSSAVADVRLMSSLQQSQLSSFSSTILITSSTTNDGKLDDNTLKRLELDKVKRIVDANTIQLQKKGLVKLAMVRMPSAGSNFQFPDCFEFSPSYKVRQLIPKRTAVRVQVVGSGKPPSVILVIDQDFLVVNTELVKTGFAKVIKQSSTAQPSGNQLVDSEELQSLQKQVEAQGLGIFSRCDSKAAKEGGGISKMPIVEAEFEPLERTMETVWTDDGGKRQLRTESSDQKATPPNPGDIKGCSDFKIYDQLCHGTRLMNHSTEMSPN